MVLKQLGSFSKSAITLFKSITLLCETKKIPKCGKYSHIFREILLVPQNIVMNLNNIMAYFVQSRFVFAKAQPCNFDEIPTYLSLLDWGTYDVYK